jgi:hypothetical protein
VCSAFSSLSFYIAKNVVIFITKNPSSILNVKSCIYKKFGFSPLCRLSIFGCFYSCISRCTIITVNYLYSFLFCHLSNTIVMYGIHNSKRNLQHHTHAAAASLQKLRLQCNFRPEGSKTIYHSNFLIPLDHIARRLRELRNNEREISTRPSHQLWLLPQFACYI